MLPFQLQIVVVGLHTPCGARRGQRGGGDLPEGSSGPGLQLGLQVIKLAIHRSIDSPELSLFEDLPCGKVFRWLSFPALCDSPTRHLLIRYIDGEVEAQRGAVICPRPRSKQVAEPGLEPRMPGSRAQFWPLCCGARKYLMTNTGGGDWGSLSGHRSC